MKKRSLMNLAVFTVAIICVVIGIRKVYVETEYLMKGYETNREEFKIEENRLNNIVRANNENLAN